MTNVESYRKNGYVLLKSLFQQSEVDVIRREAKAIFAAQMCRLGILPPADVSEAEFERGMFKFFESDLQSFTNCGKQAQHLISLHRLSLDERILRVIRELGVQCPNISTRPLLYFNSPRLATKEVYWRLSVHQDWRSMQGSLDAIVVWVPLIDIGKPLGAIEAIPGSHKWGLLRSTMTDGYGHVEEPISLTEMVSIEIEAGDALFFSAFLAHQSGTNVTDSIRWSCHFRYNNLHEATFVERGFPHPYIYRPQEELITAQFPEREQIENIFGK